MDGFDTEILLKFRMKGLILHRYVVFLFLNQSYCCDFRCPHEISHLAILRCVAAYKIFKNKSKVLRGLLIWEL